LLNVEKDHYLAMDVLFYHLEHVRLEQILPTLLEKSLERGWRACVKAGGAEQLEIVDQMLWTYSREGFLPHGGARDGYPSLQPVYLTTEDDNPNGAEVLFLVGGAAMSDDAQYERVVYLFNGLDEEMLGLARANWKKFSDKGYEVTYWRQNDRGKWVKKA